MTKHITINKNSKIPLYVQIEEQIRLLIHGGLLKPGDAMPTVRALAVELEINLNTVARVYRDLQKTGILVLKRGIGTFVADNASTSTVKDTVIERLEQQIKEIVELCNSANIAQPELFQLIQKTWKEVDHEPK